MKYCLLFLFGLLSPFKFLAQGHENTMIFGYGGGSLSPDDDDYGLNILSYNTGSLEISDNQESELFFNDTDAAISDINGKLLFYFNGIDIYNSAHKVMDNGGLLNEYNFTGYDIPQGGIILPHPGFSNQYILFHAEEGYIAPWGQACVGIYYSIVDMTQNNGLGKVILRKEPLVIDTLEYGELAVVRHANGRDWWLVVGEAHQNTFYRILINSFGIYSFGKQHVGTNRIFSFGQASFSPDGTKYTIFGGVSAGGLTQYADIYDFDRCSGLFNNHEHFEVKSTSSSGAGSAISANSRWLYIALFDKLLKYDLKASNIESTEELVGEYEPFSDPFSTKFFWMFAAPDDKIYIVTTSGSRTLHVIEKPDEPGLDCAFEQHGIRLACYNNSSLPTFANYRLGPIDGSPCDNLGINNDPVSWWRYEQDTLDPLSVEFRDLSYHEPANWSWDFGDGAPQDNQRHPMHVFATPGVYNVCLTVSNINGASTHCKTLYLGVSAAENPVLQSQIVVSPNPFSERLAVALSTSLRSPVFRLYDQMGRLIREEPLAYGITELETGSMPVGMYFWVVSAAGEMLKSGKLLKSD